MLDFLMISTRSGKRGIIEIYPKFIIKKSNDLMIRGGDFYAIWIDERGIWSTDEQDAVDLIDRELDQYAEENRKRFDGNIRVLHMWDAETGMIDTWHKYCQKQMKDQFHMLDEKLIFSNTKSGKRDFASKALPYPLEPGDTPAWDKLISTLYSPEERHKIEWSIGAIVSGESKRIQKFLVFYGAVGTGKSTIINVIQQLFEGYYTSFNAKDLGSSSNAFALEAFRSNPLVAIQHDGDLSRIEDNTRINSLVSHEMMTVNEKFRSAYSNRFKAFLIMAGLWMGLFCLTACGGADVRTYQYPETSVLFDDFHIKKTVYSPGVMKLYYRGGQFKDTPIRCYDANFEDLGDQFEYSFQNGVLTVQADFAEQISGLTIEDKDHDTVYHLRYLDSPQFAWLADTFWLDYGMMTMGDEARYYSDAERQAQAERESAEHEQTRDVFALLEGTWISEDGVQKYVFSENEDGTHWYAEELWFDETEQKWNGWELCVESAFQTPYFGGEYSEDVAEHLQEIVLGNSDHAAADMCVLYDSEENVIRDTNTIYHKQ